MKLGESFKCQGDAQVLSQFDCYWSNTCKLAGCYSIFYCSKQHLKYPVCSLEHLYDSVLFYRKGKFEFYPVSHGLMCVLHLVNEMPLNIKVLSNEVMLSEVKHPV